MNDDRQPGGAADDPRRHLVDQFLKRTLADVERMRRNLPLLESGDRGAWNEMLIDAQRIVTTARALELGILSGCARELTILTEEQFSGARLDAAFLLATNSAIEMVAIELEQLLRAG